jgi:hypothetical protein
MKTQKKMLSPIDSTKEYAERTYYTVKSYKSEAANLINPSLFWSELANFFINCGQKDFFSSSTMYLNSPIDYVLASAFISSENSNAFDLSSSGGSL